MKQHHRMLALFIALALLFTLVAVFSCSGKPIGQYKKFKTHCNVNMTGSN